MECGSVSWLTNCDVTSAAEVSDYIAKPFPVAASRDLSADVVAAVR
jgi:hypothetical protein